MGVGDSVKRVGSPEISVHLYQTVLRQIPEDRDVYSTTLFLTFPISNLLEKIQYVNFKIWPIITLFKSVPLSQWGFFDTIRIPIPVFFN